MRPPDPGSPSGSQRAGDTGPAAIDGAAAAQESARAAMRTGAAHARTLGVIDRRGRLGDRSDARWTGVGWKTVARAHGRHQVVPESAHRYPAETELVLLLAGTAERRRLQHQR